jgi:hypothetical protein
MAVFAKGELTLDAGKGQRDLLRAKTERIDGNSVALVEPELCVRKRPKENGARTRQYPAP